MNGTKRTLVLAFSALSRKPATTILKAGFVYIHVWSSRATHDEEPGDSEFLSDATLGYEKKIFDRASSETFKLNNSQEER